MTDIVERLRHEAAQWHPSQKSPIRHLLEAADEIERLRADLTHDYEWVLDNINSADADDMATSRPSAPDALGEPKP